MYIMIQAFQLAIVLFNSLPKIMCLNGTLFDTLFCVVFEKRHRSLVFETLISFVLKYISNFNLSAITAFNSNFILADCIFNDL